MHTTIHRLLYAGIAVILLTSAYLLGASTGGSLGAIVPSTLDYQKGYDAGYARAQDELAATASGPLTAPTNVLSGSVSELRAGGFAMTVAGKGPGTRIVTVGSATVLEDLIRKDAEAFQQELTAFAKRKPKPGEVPPVPPSPVSTSTLTLDLLAVGDQVTVIAAAGADLSAAQKIEAPAQIIRVSRAATSTLR